MVLYRQVISTVQAGIIGNYAAELIFFLFKISESMLEPSARLYIYDAVCLQELNSRHRCTFLQRYPEQERLVQSKAAEYIMYYKVLLNLPAVLLVLICGAWSDTSGRKVPIMLTCSGAMLAVLMYMLSSQVGGGKGPFLPLILLGAGIRGACGRSAVMSMACHSYVSDISNEETRTRKLAHLVAMSHFGYLTGCTIAGSLLDTMGYVIVFCVVLFLQAFCLFMCFICMRETIADSSDHNSSPILEDQDEDAVVVCRRNKGCPAFRQLSACLQVLRRKRTGFRRCYILLLVLMVSGQQTCKSGEMDMVMLYVQRAPLSWMSSTYSYLLGVDYACLGFMAFFILPILISCLHMADKYLVLTGLTFKIARTLMLAFSDSTWMIFTAIAIGAPHSFAISGLKSMISKLVENDEIGKAFSILSSVETISNLFGTVIFANVYAAMLPVWPGFGFILEAGMYGIIHILMMLLSCATLGDNSKPLLEKTVEPPPVKNYGTMSKPKPTKLNIPVHDEPPSSVEIRVHDYNAQSQVRIG